MLIRISLDGSPGFSRIRRSWQYAAAPVDTHRLKPVEIKSRYTTQESRLQPVQAYAVEAVPAANHGQSRQHPGKYRNSGMPLPRQAFTG